MEAIVHLHSSELTSHKQIASFNCRQSQASIPANHKQAYRPYGFVWRPEHVYDEFYHLHLALSGEERFVSEKFSQDAACRPHVWRRRKQYLNSINGKNCKFQFFNNLSTLLFNSTLLLKTYNRIESQQDRNRHWIS